MEFVLKLLILLAGLFSREHLMPTTTALPVNLCGQDLENRLILICGRPVSIPPFHCCQGAFCLTAALQDYCGSWPKNIEESNLAPSVFVQAEYQPRSRNYRRALTYMKRSDPLLRRVPRYISVTKSRPGPDIRLRPNTTAIGDPYYNPECSHHGHFH